MMEIERTCIFFVPTDDTFATKFFDKLFFFVPTIFYYPRGGAFTTAESTIRPRKMFGISVDFAGFRHLTIITLSVGFVRCQKVCNNSDVRIFRGSSMVEQLPVDRQPSAARRIE